LWHLILALGAKSNLLVYWATASSHTKSIIVGIILTSKKLTWFLKKRKRHEKRRNLENKTNPTVKKNRKEKKRERKRKKRYCEKEVRSSWKRPLEFAQTKQKGTKTSHNHLLRVSYSTWWQGTTHWEYPSLHWSICF